MHGWAFHVVELCWLCWLGVWAVLAVSAKRTARRPERGWSLASHLMLWSLVLVFLRPDGFQHHLLYSDTAAVSVAGVTLAAAGLAFTSWARLTLGGNWSGDITVKEDHTLVQTGPYRLARHPIYTGILAMALGTVLVDATLMGWIVLVVACAGLVGKLRAEERVMTAQFPDDYPGYRRRVKAVIPFVL